MNGVPQALAHVLAVSFAGVAATSQQPVCVVSVPGVFAERVEAVVQRLVAGAVVAESPDVRHEPPQGADVLLLHDEWALARLAAAGALSIRADTGIAYELPWSCEYVVAAAGDAVPADRDAQWEELALAPSLHDRLAIVAPEVDGAPWSLALAHRTAVSGTEDDGIALWTTLDARAGRLLAGYDELRTGLADARFAAGVGPLPLLAEVAKESNGRVRLVRLRGNGRAAFGIALVAGAGESARAAVARLTEADAIDELARACGMLRSQLEPSIDPTRADAQWRRFERDVRGRGRGVEQLADWLDLAFVVAFVAAALVLWRFLRTSSGE